MRLTKIEAAEIIRVVKFPPKDLDYGDKELVYMNEDYAGPGGELVTPRQAVAGDSRVTGFQAGGFAGGLRNAQMMLLNFLQGEVHNPDAYPDGKPPVPINGDLYNCDGIATTTAATIDFAIRQGNPKLARFKSAVKVTRGTGVASDLIPGSGQVATIHAAAGLLWKAGDLVAFDWHSTLNLDDPEIYPSRADWERATGAVRFSAM